MSNVSGVLSEAAELIRRHGWVQRKSGSIGEGFCLIGAVINVTRDKHQCFLANEALIRASGTISIVTWNDTEGRTKEEVLELLERAARDTR